KVLMGVERRSMIISDTEKRTIAYHEAGHTLVADFLPGTDPVHKVTIIPRGRALGLTQQLPLDDKYNYSKEYLVNRIPILLRPRAPRARVARRRGDRADPPHSALPGSGCPGVAADGSICPRVEPHSETSPSATTCASRSLAS